MLFGLTTVYHFAVYQAVVIATLLHGCESWTIYQRCTQPWPVSIPFLRHIAKINLARQNTALIYAFVASPVDYCNALMASTTDKLQRALNAAALRLLAYILTYLTRKFRTSEKYQVLIAFIIRAQLRWFGRMPRMPNSWSQRLSSTQNCRQL